MGSPYKIKGVLYKPQSNCKGFVQVGTASWYGRKDGFHNKKTANGDTYHFAYLTAAHPTLPMPCLIKVTNLKNKHSLILMVNDRGPFVKNRVLDVSERSAELLGFKNQGTTQVKIEFLHQETQKLLNTLSFKSKKNIKKAASTKNKGYPVNHYVQLINIKHRCLNKSNKTY